MFSDSFERILFLFRIFTIIINIANRFSQFNLSPRINLYLEIQMFSSAYESRVSHMISTFGGKFAILFFSLSLISLGFFLKKDFLSFSCFLFSKWWNIYPSVICCKPYFPTDLKSPLSMLICYTYWFWTSFPLCCVIIMSPVLLYFGHHSFTYSLFLYSFQCWLILYMSFEF